MNANQPIYYDMDMARTSYRVLHEVQTRVKDKCLVSDEKLLGEAGKQEILQQMFRKF